MCRIEASAGFPAALCLLCLLPEPGAFLLAAAVHELAHVLAALAQRGRIEAVRLRFGGAELELAHLGYRQELLCALSGPAVNLVCSLLLRKAFPAFAACSLLLGLFNALPVYPLDGGRCVYLLLTLLEDADAAARHTGRAAMGTLLALLLAAFYAALRLQLGLWPLFLWAWIGIRGNGGCFSLGKPVK